MQIDTKIQTKCFDSNSPARQQHQVQRSLSLGTHPKQMKTKTQANQNHFIQIVVAVVEANANIKHHLVYDHK